MNKQSSYLLILVVLVLLLELPCLKTLWKAINKRKSLGEKSSPLAVLAARSSTMVYLEKMYHFHTDQKEEVQRNIFLDRFKFIQ